MRMSVLSASSCLMQSFDVIPPQADDNLRSSEIYQAMAVAITFRGKDKRISPLLLIQSVRGSAGFEIFPHSASRAPVVSQIISAADFFHNKTTTHRIPHFIVKDVWVVNTDIPITWLPVVIKYGRTFRRFQMSKRMVSSRLAIRFVA